MFCSVVVDHAALHCGAGKIILVLEGLSRILLSDDVQNTIMGVYHF